MLPGLWDQGRRVRASRGCGELLLRWRAARARVASSLDGDYRAKGLWMRTTLVLDDALLAEAQRLTGTTEKTALVREALGALIERESARRLARLGGTSPQLAAAPRRRPDDV